VTHQRTRRNSSSTSIEAGLAWLINGLLEKEEASPPPSPLLDDNLEGNEALRGDYSEMTIDDYYAAVRLLGLRKTAVSTVYYHPAIDDYFHVDDPAPMTPAQRAESIELLTARLGLDRPH
jgi:hypothetical protein